MVEEQKYMTENEKARAFENISVEWYRYLADIKEKMNLSTCEYHEKITKLISNGK